MKENKKGRKGKKRKKRVRKKGKRSKRVKSKRLRVKDQDCNCNCNCNCNRKSGRSGRLVAQFLPEPQGFRCIRDARRWRADRARQWCVSVPCVFTVCVKGECHVRGCSPLFVSGSLQEVTLQCQAHRAEHPTQRRRDLLLPPHDLPSTSEA